MEKSLFQGLRGEIKRDYGFTKKSIHFIPFEEWRKKLQTYPDEFKDEYMENTLFLKKKLGLTHLRRIKNHNKKLILFVGIPGVGKTTLSHIIQEFLPNTILLRGHDIVDALHLFDERKVETYRERLIERRFKNPDPWYISYLYQEQLTRDCLQLGYNVIFDDHIRTRENRLGYYKLAKKNGAKIIFIQINAPFEMCLKREEGKIDNEKLRFLANFIFQSQDISEEERKKYDKVILVDGTSKISEIERKLISQINKV